MNLPDYSDYKKALMTEETSTAYFHYFDDCWLYKTEKQRTSLAPSLSHFMSLISFYIPLKISKTSGFLFAGGTKRNQWREMGCHGH